MSNLKILGKENFGLDENLMLEVMKDVVQTNVFKQNHEFFMKCKTKCDTIFSGGVSIMGVGMADLIIVGSALSNDSLPVDVKQIIAMSGVIGLYTYQSAGRVVDNNAWHYASQIQQVIKSKYQTAEVVKEYMSLGKTKKEAEKLTLERFASMTNTDREIMDNEYFEKIKAYKKEHGLKREFYTSFIPSDFDNNKNSINQLPKLEQNNNNQDDLWEEYKFLDQQNQEIFDEIDEQKELASLKDELDDTMDM